MPDYYGLGYGLDSGLTRGAATGIGSLIWIIITFIAAIVGCFLIYFMFVKKDGKTKNPKLDWLKSFLRFDKMLIETILKIAYIFSTIFITLFPFVFLSMGITGFVICILTIIIGNLVNRIVYEGLLIMIMIWKNTTVIKDKMK